MGWHGMKKLVSNLIRIASSYLSTYIRLVTCRVGYTHSKNPLVSIIKLLMNEMRLGGTYNCTKSVLDAYWREKVLALIKHLSSKSLAKYGEISFLMYIGSPESIQYSSISLLEKTILHLLLPSKRDLTPTYRSYTHTHTHTL
jgi:hypothetical protein